MTKKSYFILVMIGMGYLVWSGGFQTAMTVQAREKQEKQDRTRSVSGFEDENISSSSEDIETLRPSTTPSLIFKEEGDDEDLETPVPTPSAESSDTPEPTPSATPESRSPGRQLALGILNFFRGPGSDPEPPAPEAGVKGLNLLSSDHESSPYPSENPVAKLWYVGIGVLALLGASTFMYGRSKHTG